MTMMPLMNALITAGVLALSGCATNEEHRPAEGYVTRVDQNRNNFRVIKACAKGESSGFSLLGILQFVSPSYTEAKEKMYASAGGHLEGKAVTLVNQTEEYSSIYLILFSIPKLTLTADVIEYTDDPVDKK